MAAISLKTLTVASSHAVTTVEPLPLKLTMFTASVCPFSVLMWSGWFFSAACWGFLWVFKGFFGTTDDATSRCWPTPQGVSEVSDDVASPAGLLTLPPFPDLDLDLDLDLNLDLLPPFYGA